jgi:peptidyl-prolyl cis-trans isomerase SurA
MKVRTPGLVMMAVLATVVATAGTGRAQEGELIDRIVAVVEDEAIFLSDVEQVVRQIMLQEGRLSLSEEERAALAEKVLQDLINDRLVIAQAGRLGIEVPFKDVEEQVERALEENRRLLGGEEAFERQLAREGFTIDELKRLYRRQIKNRMLVERVLQAEMAKQRREVSDDELRRYYDEHRAEIPERPAVVHLKTIFIPFAASAGASSTAREKIDDIHRRLLAGEPFADLARDHSEDPSAPGGGDLGWLRISDLSEPAFAAAAAALEIGEVSEPVLTTYGYHVIQATERNPVTGEVRLRHILIRAQASEGDIEEVFETATEIREALLTGAPFDSLADRYSSDPNSGPGGDLGWLKVADLPQFFQDVLTEMKLGEISQVLRESAGFRIVKLEGSEDVRPYEFDEVRQELMRLYQGEQAGVMYADYVEGLREKFHVDLKGEPPAVD